MFTITWIKRMTFGLALITMIVLISTATAANACKKVSGKFTLQAFANGCMSTVSICATGTYSGDLKGTSTFVGSSLTPTADTPTTSVVLLTGDNTIQTKGGTLLTKDAIVLATTGRGEFAEVDTVVSGTGAWMGATSRMSGTGTFLNGQGAGEYSGEICVP